MIEQLICAFGECKSVAVARFLCDTHYNYERRHGLLVDRGRMAKVKGAGPCSMEGCEKKIIHGNMCNWHWVRKTNSEKIARGEICITLDCGRAQGASGYCVKCRQNLAKGEKEPLPECRVAGCATQATGKGYAGLECDLHLLKCALEDCPQETWRGAEWCSRHYQRIRNHGEPGPIDRMKRLPFTGTDWFKTDQGYVIRIITRTPKDRVQESQHRVFMEEHIGRKLTKSENVHHKNGRRDDNRLDNLEIWNTSQPSGQRVPDKMRWVVELIAQYPDEYQAALLEAA